ncbi:fibropellin-1-like [Haliotis cracherodii]|uniref:fibropellin-1-like n=1 Tax=Haliotis cracherodii TaxID=6455 RepID=UPI0039E98357
MLDMRKLLLFLSVVAVGVAVPPAEDCSPGVSSFRPHETDCAKFYQCNINVWAELTCGEGTVFNPIAQVCDWPYNVECPSPSDPTDACSTAPCENGGSCATSGNTYVCTCLPNYMGNNCETPTTTDTCMEDDRESLNDLQCALFRRCVGGVWVDYRCPENSRFNPQWKDCFLPSQYPCPTIPCDSNPCLNGGACTNSGTTFTCTCPDTHEGDTCETPVTSDGPGGACSASDPYQANPNDCSKFYACVNNFLVEFTCPPVTPSFNEATGSCDFVYNVQCGKLSSCTNDTRLSGNSRECDEFYRCVQQEWVQYKCPAGYRFSDAIKDCSDGVDCPTATTTDLPCDSNPCLNNGVCSNFGGSFSCQCPAGYGGETCEIPPQPCDSGPCKNGGACTNQGSSYVCSCLPNYAQPNCETLSAVNGGWSEWSVVGTPSTCSKICGGGQQQVSRIRTCTNPPPSNGGLTCQGDNTDTIGVACNTNPCQPCDSGPCKNGGACTNQGSSYVCVCLPNYAQPNCETLSAVNGGWSEWSVVGTPSTCSKICGGGQQQVSRIRTCTNPPPSNGGLTCQGDNTDTIGFACNTSPCPCASQPCNNGTCVDVSDTIFTCECPVYRVGTFCQNECDYPCPPGVGIIYPDLVDPSKFVSCFQGMRIVRSCPVGATYSYTQNNCV